MAREPYLSQLCELCEHINFAAILTPREYNNADGTTRAIYRPELNGNGLSPVASWMSTKERKNAQHPPGTIRVRLPIIKTAYYEDLSESDLDNDDDDDEKAPLHVHPEDRALVVVGNDPIEDECPSTDLNKDDERGHVTARDGDDEVASLASDVRERLAAELSDIEDEDDAGTDDEAWGDEADDESVATISTWSGLSHFTENNRIDLNKQAAGNWNYCHGDLYYLGSIWDVRSRRHRCDLCRELWGRMRKNPLLKEEYITKSRCILKLMELGGRKVDDPAKVVKTLSLTFIYGYKFDDPRNTDWVVRNPLVLGGTHRDVAELDDQRLPDQIPSFQDMHYGEARWKSGRCDFGLLRGWLQTCTAKHDHLPLDSHVKVHIRLVDVVQMCLVEFDASNSVIPDYVALSYTWGASKPRNMLTVSQLQKAKAPGYFKAEDLNSTFRDSIALCSGMNQRFLWIDALCIIQDDPNDKLQQIPQMREIYGRSLFTIVAAYGDNADAGLPRVSGAGRSTFRLEFKDIRVFIRGSCKIYSAQNKLDIGFCENYIRGCAYLSRAWTYQEGFLSPRLLIFTQDKVYWECDRCTWCDDTHWESDEIDFVGLRAIKGSTPTDVWNDRFERHAYDLRSSDDDKEPVPSISSYAAVVKEYSNRSLTEDSDMLHACNGVLSYIREKEQSDFLFGLREKHFGNDLLFNYWTAIIPRFPGKMSTQSGFPSWSWTAWRGSIQVANQARGNSYDLAENLIPCDGVRCFTLQADSEGSISVRLINESGGWQFEHGHIRRGEGIYDPRELSFERDTAPDRADAPSISRRPDSSNSQDSGNQIPGEFTGNAEKNTQIPVYDQDVVLTDLTKHQSFKLMQPGFHIVFKTFSTLVVVVLDYDDYVISRGNPVIGGTVTLRSEGVWGNKDQVARKVYACRRIRKSDSLSLIPTPAPAHEDDACPCCGKNPKLKAIPEGFELGPYLGRLPGLSTARDPREYLSVVPDGLYKMLWMNNNQLPMFGHLLCKPVSPTAAKDGTWDGEIMQRVSGVIGPTEIITKEHQAQYCAEWGTHILA